jgi:ABC-type transport system involved in multi-copper enzyme maturation permease subunit
MSPIIWRELLLIGRRSRIGRAVLIYGAALAIQFVILLLTFRFPRQSVGRFVNSYLEIFIVQSFFLLWMITPAFVAGAIAEEKSRGTLSFLLTTGLTSKDIILGKLAAKGIQLIYLSATGWPFLFAVAGLMRVSLALPLAVILTTALPGFFVAAVTVWSSVRNKGTRRAALHAYMTTAAVAGTVLAILWSSGLDETLSCAVSPAHLLFPIWQDGNWMEFARRFGIASSIYGGIGAVFLVVAIRQLRPVFARDADADLLPESQSDSFPDRPIEDDPIRWRERTIVSHHSTLVYGLVVAGFSLASLGVIMFSQPGPFLYLGLLVPALAGFAAGVRASGAITSERERQTWESLLITPLETRRIIEHKVWAAQESVYPYLLAGTLPALPLSTLQGFTAAVYTSVFMILAFTFIVYMSALGVLYSARSASSWRSLAATLGSGYAYLFTGLVVAALCYECTCLLLSPVGFDLGYAVALLVFARMMWRRAGRLVTEAETFVDVNERFGRSFTRSLARALRKMETVQAQKQKEGDQPDAPTTG